MKGVATTGVSPSIDRTCGLAYSPAKLDAAKLRILGGSTISAVIGVAMLVVLTSRGR